ncbi:MAG: hypothetical protein ACR2HR_04015 [Euzebya sp.]
MKRVGATKETAARALTVAQGSPLWFREAVRAEWFGDGLPMPAALRELADYHLSRLASAVITALELTCVAGAVTAATLVSAGGEEAVQAGLDAGLLRLTDHELLVMDNVFLRSRLEERVSLRHDVLIASLRTAASAQDDGLPLLDLGTHSPPELNGPMLSTLVASAPTQVLAALERVPLPLPEDLALAKGRALLSGGQIPSATQTLRTLARTATDPEIRVDAASLLALTQARLLEDMPGARHTVATTARTIQDPDLQARLRSRRVAIELFGRGTPQPPTDVPQESRGVAAFRRQSHRGSVSAMGLLRFAS